jgi:hypothetical protein
MKKITLIALAICTTLGAIAQNIVCKKTYLGLQTGINNNNGIIGLSIEQAVAKKWTLNTGVGIGSWGYKFFAEGRYYFHANCYRNTAIGLAFTNSTGFKGLKPSGLETNYGKVDVLIDGAFISNASFSFYKFWSIGKKRSNKFYLSAGYSLRLTEINYQIANETKNKYSGIQLSENSNNAIRAITPGGIILGLGFYFRL